MLHFVLIIMRFSSIFFCGFFSNTYDFSDASVLGATVYVFVFWKSTSFLFFTYVNAIM